MKLNDYQDAANMTSAYRGQQSIERLAFAVFMLNSEAGEIAGHMQKVIGQGHSLDPHKVALELGDVLWALCEACSALGLTLDDIARRNVAKLADRYPDGFDEERSRRRYE